MDTAARGPESVSAGLAGPEFVSFEGGPGISGSAGPLPVETTLGGSSAAVAAAAAAVGDPVESVECIRNPAERANFPLELTLTTHKQPDLTLLLLTCPRRAVCPGACWSW